MTGYTDLSRAYNLATEQSRVRAAINAIDKGEEPISITLDHLTDPINTTGMTFSRDAMVTLRDFLIDRDDEITELLTGLGVADVPAPPYPPDMP